MKPGQTRAKSVVLVHTGDGKGKSSSAWGVMIRGVARGWKVAVVQSIKSGQWNTGEEKIGKRLGVDWWTIGEGFSWESEDLTKDEAVAKEAWKQARALITAGAHDLVILDEISYPMTWGWIDTDDVVATVRDRPEHVHVVLTGRNMADAVVEIADTVTEMKMVKHAYQRGIVAKKGIEY